MFERLIVWVPTGVEPKYPVTVTHVELIPTKVLFWVHDPKYAEVKLKGMVRVMVMVAAPESLYAALGSDGKL